MDDLISRQEAIKEFDCCELTPDGGIDVNYAIDFLNQLPPAQPERKTGRWIIHENADIVDGYYVPKYECSYCHTWKNDDSDFCPDCGADMRGEEDETVEG